jgi:hypothetical protein
MQRDHGSSRSGSDIIFAYHLHAVAQRGWRYKRVEIGVYAPKPAFLNNEKHAVKELATLKVAEENEDD